MKTTIVENGNQCIASFAGRLDTAAAVQTAEEVKPLLELEHKEIKVSWGHKVQLVAVAVVAVAKVHKVIKVLKEMLVLLVFKAIKEIEVPKVQWVHKVRKVKMVM